MTEKRFKQFTSSIDYYEFWDTVDEKGLTKEDVVDLLNKQQTIIKKQEEIIKSQDIEISRQYNLCLAMSGVLRKEFGVYDVFDRTKDRKIE